MTVIGNRQVFIKMCSTKAMEHPSKGRWWARIKLSSGIPSPSMAY